MNTVCKGIHNFIEIIQELNLFWESIWFTKNVPYEIR